MGISSDGDPRLLSSMRSKVKFDLEVLEEECLRKHFENFDGIVLIQDTIHIGTKMRNRLLKPGIVLPMGSSQVALAHIKILLNSVSKEIHGLVLNDICPEDRQNFGSLQKLMHPRVTKSLETHILGSEATVKYLWICDQITSSFLSDELKPIDRIHRIWTALYYLRAWRAWLKKSNYVLSENFITANAYACVEINAHGLISAIQKLRSINKPELFLSNFFASQPCEHIFRQMRSMGSANYTKINFTLFELFHLISRVDLSNKIMFESIKSKNMSFPRTKNIFEVNPPDQLPSDQEILNALKSAQLDGLEAACELGMSMSVEDVSKCEVLQTNAQTMTEEMLDDIVETETDPFDCIDYSESFAFSKFIDVLNEDGTKKHVKKSTFVWMLSQSKSKLSSDRLKRVQDATKTDYVKRRKLEPTNDDSLISKSNELQIGSFFSIHVNSNLFFNYNLMFVGNWCFFKNMGVLVASLSEQNVVENCILGNVIAFKYAKEKSMKSKLYTLDFAPTSPGQTNETDQQSNTNIQVLATWYICNNEGVLNPVEANCHFFVDIKNYVATITDIISKERKSDSQIILSIPSEQLGTLKKILFQFLTSK